MELAVNSFNKGLQTDTHPMILGTDTLSDCLNGTLVTMNGNEIILLNDMGNRRVNNAYLPPGYLPVGMKEYGGVIYIAAYNPITNKSQIGSFPSPLRKINNEINRDLLGNHFEFYKVFESPNVVEYTLKNIDNTTVLFLDNDVFLMPLTTDIVLHAGDKFVVSARGLRGFINYITNYENTNSEVDGKANTTKAITPKNRRFTLSLGVLNSQNEFVDITKTLCRWKLNENGDWEIQAYNSSYSDIFKFNDGYFIPEQYNNDTLDETIEDARLIRVRQTIPANTYSYKLIGPLYLKVAFNHIETFSFSIYGFANDLENESNSESQESESESRSVNLLIEAFVTYNCPDGANEGNDNNDERLPVNKNLDYETFDEGKPTFRIFDLIDSSSNGIRECSKDTNYRNSIYNPDNNLYSLKLIKYYNDVISDSHIYNYFIGVLADKELSEEENQDPIYLRGLSVEGTIDLDLLGSGQVVLNTYLFHNEINEDRIRMLFLIGLNAYASPGEYFDNLRFKLEDIESGDIYYGPLKNQASFNFENGIDFTSSINALLGLGYAVQFAANETQFRNSENLSLPKRKAFKVTMYYDKRDKSTDQIIETESFGDEEGNEHWYLSTGLFNEFFKRDPKVIDYCKVVTDPNESGYYKKFADKMIVLLEPISEFKSSSTTDSTLSGSLISKNSTEIEYRCNNTLNFELEYSTDVRIKDEELYPDFITINDSDKVNALQANELYIRFDGVTGTPSINLNSESEISENEVNKLYQKAVKNTMEYDDFLEKEGNPSYELVNDQRFNQLFSVTNITSENHTITGTINHDDLLLGEGEVVEHADIFEHFFDFIDDNYNDVVGHHGVVMNYDRDAGSDDPNRIIWVVKCLQDQNIDYLYKLPPDNNEPNIEYYRIGYPITGGYDEDKILNFTFTGIYNNHSIKSLINLKTFSDYQSLGNTSLPKENNNLVFSYIFSPFYKIGASTIHATKKLDKPNLILVSDIDTNSGYALGLLFARLWWRQNNGNWALFNKLITHGLTMDYNGGYGAKDYEKTRLISPNRREEYKNHSYFVNYLTIMGLKDYVYCTKLDYNFSEDEDKFYSINNNTSYVYSNEHQIKELYLGIKFVLNNQNIEDIDYSNYKWGNLLFTFNNDSICTEEVKYNNLGSNTKFYDNIDNFLNQDSVPLYINTGLMYDKNGKLLKSNCVYYLNNNNLLVETKDVVVDTLENGKRILLLDSQGGGVIKEASSEIIFRYDSIGIIKGAADVEYDTDTIPPTLLDYAGVDLVSNQIFKNNNV